MKVKYFKNKSNFVVRNEFVNINVDVEQNYYKESSFDDINIEEPLYEPTPETKETQELNNSLNIDFESVSINEPIYETQQPIEVEEKSTKKIKIKKTKVNETNETKEEKQKKTRVIKKK
jgi:hypothetical protein